MVLAKYCESNWIEQKNKYLSDHPSFGNKVYQTLQEAIEKCSTVGFEDCGGVTKDSSGFNPRRDHIPRESP